MAIYRKNLRSPEQIIRIAVGLAATAASAIYLDGWPMGLVAAGGLVFALTGIVGYCPMCAVAGIDRTRS